MNTIKRVLLSWVYVFCLLTSTLAFADNTQVNINTASVEELQQIKGIGQKRAEAIVAYREAHGPFVTVEDLMEVKGIGDATLSRNNGILVVE